VQRRISRGRADRCRKHRRYLDHEHFAHDQPCDLAWCGADAAQQRKFTARCRAATVTAVAVAAATIIAPQPPTTDATVVSAVRFAALTPRGRAVSSIEANAIRIAVPRNTEMKLARTPSPRGRPCQRGHPAPLSARRMLARRATKSSKRVMRSATVAIVGWGS
jgi:hypothetical protein